MLDNVSETKMLSISILPVLRVVVLDEGIALVLAHQHLILIASFKETLSYIVSFFRTCAFEENY